ncbi:MAG: hypothetical protein U0521_23220 [Anaerolineae bacterium]
MQTRTEASDYLVEMAKRCAEPYIALPAIRAILLTGSVAEGVSDFYSRASTRSVLRRAAARRSTGGSSGATATWIASR